MGVSKEKKKKRQKKERKKNKKKEKDTGTGDAFLILKGWKNKMRKPPDIIILSNKSTNIVRNIGPKMLSTKTVTIPTTNKPYHKLKKTI